MIETLRETSLYKSLNLSKTHHAYLFSSLDKELNNNIALLFAKSLICENKTGCNICSACKQFETYSHPDYIKLEQDAIKVEDVNNLIDKLNTLPISSSHKVFVILNAETINEISQNKLLKSFEEPNPTNIFILTTSKVDKLLPTVLSRLNKISVPKISQKDLMVIHSELKQNNVDISKYFSTDLNLTEILNFETNENYQKTLGAIKYIFENLNSSQSIPKVVNTLPDYDKNLILPIMQKLFLNCINNQSSFDEYVTTLIKTNYPTQALINCLPHIESSYKKQKANVNLSYILDNLLFNILKEKFLCKQ